MADLKSDAAAAEMSDAELDAEDEAAAREAVESEENVRSFVLMRLAEVLRDDISPVACLCCDDGNSQQTRNRAACPCFATLHPFCDLFHTWLCHRLIDDGAGTCCLLPSQVITDPRNDSDAELEAAEEDHAALVQKAAEAKADAEAATANAPNDGCDATRFADSDDDEDGSENDPPAPNMEYQEDWMPSANASDNEEAPTDPLTSQLRAQASTASAVVYALEKNVGNIHAQREELHSQLMAPLCDLTTAGVPLAMEEILEWYSVLSILACSFPTQKELQAQRKKADLRAAAEAAAKVAEDDAKQAAQDAADAAARAAALATEAAQAAEEAKRSDQTPNGDGATDAAHKVIEAAEKAEKAATELAAIAAAEQAGLEDLASKAADVDGARAEAETGGGNGGKGGGGGEESEEDGDDTDDDEDEEEGEDSSEIIQNSLGLPPLLLRSTDVGQPLRPIYLGAATEKDAGQWFMGLQGLRESPAKSIEDLCARRWLTWQQSHCKYLLKSVRALRQCKRLKPARLLHEWLAVNDYCDWVQAHFTDLFTAEVLSEWYSRAGTWCQGCANLSMALLVGVDSWQMCRDFMNMRSREFRRDPKIASAETEDNTETLVEILRNPPRMPFAVYVEIDCWNWDMAKATKTGGASPVGTSPGSAAPATAAGLCRGADGELLGGGSTSTPLSPLSRASGNGSGGPPSPLFAPPPVYFGAAAVAESAAAVVQAARESAAAVVHAALLESPLSEAAKAAAAKAAAAATNGPMPPVTIPATITSSKPVEGLTVDIGDGKEEADGNGDGGGKKEHRLAARGGEDAEEQGEEEAEAEDVYVPLDVLHSGPINAKQPGDDSASGGEEDEPAPSPAPAPPPPPPPPPQPPADPNDEEALIAAVTRVRLDGAETVAACHSLLVDEFEGLTISQVKKANSKAVKRAGGFAPPASEAPAPSPAVAENHDAFDADREAYEEGQRVYGRENAAAELAESEKVTGMEKMPTSEPLVHGRRVTSRVNPLANSSLRPNGGHVFLIQIEAPPDEDEEEEGEEGEMKPRYPPGEIPLSCYTIYSSWSGRYTLQQWMDQRPELIQMSSSSLELWLAALRAMIKCKEWSPEAEELITFMFGAETSNGSESDEDEEEDDEEEEGKEKEKERDSETEGGLCDVADRFAAEASAANPTADGSCGALPDPSTLAAAPSTEPPAAADDTKLPIAPPRLPYLAAVELGLVPPIDHPDADVEGYRLGTFGLGAYSSDANAPSAKEKPSTEDLTEKLANGGILTADELKQLKRAAQLEQVRQAAASGELITSAAPGVAPVVVPPPSAAPTTPAPVTAAAAPAAQSDERISATSSTALPATKEGEDGEEEEDEEEGEETWVSPASGWAVENEDDVMWELHFWARGYDRNQLAYNAAVIEQLHKVARVDHESIVSRVAADIIPKLDRLQARTLHGAPFGHRCARNTYFGYAAKKPKGAKREGGEEDDEEEEDGEEEESEEEAPTGVSVPVVPPVVAVA